MEKRKDYIPDIMLIATAYITLISVAIGALSFYTNTLNFYGSLVLFILIGIVMGFQPWSFKYGKEVLYLAVLTVLTSCLYFFDVNPGIYLVIFFVISAQAMMMLPRIWGPVWVLVLAAISALSFVALEGFQDGFLTMFVYGGGYLFFGIFGRSLMDATRESVRKVKNFWPNYRRRTSSFRSMLSGVEELGCDQRAQPPGA